MSVCVCVCFVHLCLRVCARVCSDAVGVYVKEVVPGSPADLSGNIRVQDRLLAVSIKCLWF